jgi:DNA-binding transcriptional regulator YhcF (GntR family)
VLIVDPDSPVPPYEQVRAQLAEAIENGEIATGSRLQTVRKLAADLGLAVNTVARSYKELEAAGLVAARGRNGTIVIGTASPARRAATAAAQQYLQRIRELGISPAEGLAIVRREVEL